jgi:hypothetical protein
LFYKRKCAGKADNIFKSLINYFGPLLAMMKVNSSTASSHLHLAPWEDAMDRQEVIEMCMECPLYFTMPLKMRLDFVKRREGAHPATGLREAIISWVKTGLFPPADQTTLRNE